MTVNATHTEVDLSEVADQYATQGYVLVKHLLSRDEAAAYRAESHRLLADLARSDDPTWGSAAELAGDRPTRLQHLHDAQFYSAAFSRLLVDDRFVSESRELLGNAAQRNRLRIELHGDRAPQQIGLRSKNP